MNIRKTWHNMINRCKPDSVHRKNYADRGISVCDEWLDFDTFRNDMGPPPNGKYTIDRIDNNSGYRKSNCRWATQSEQGRNRRGNHMVNFHGEDITVAELAERLGEKQNTVLCKIRRGWTLDEIEAGHRDIPTRSIIKNNINRIIAWRRDGRSQTEIGKLLGVHSSNISRELCRLGHRTLTKTKQERQLKGK